MEYQVEDINHGTDNSYDPDKKTRNFSEHGLTCLSWNSCPFEPEKIAVGGYSKKAAVYSLEQNTFKEVKEKSSDKCDTPPFNIYLIYIPNIFSNVY